MTAITSLTFSISFVTSSACSAAVRFDIYSCLQHAVARAQRQATAGTNRSCPAREPNAVKLVHTPAADGALENPTDEELGVAIEDNLFAFFRAMASLPGAELVQTPELGRHCAPPTNPMFKGVWAPRLEPDQVEPAIDDVL